MGGSIGTGLGYLVGGLAVQFADALRSLGLDSLIELHNWQITFVTVGLPGFLLSIVILATVREPTRKETLSRQPTFGSAINHIRSNLHAYGTLIGGAALNVACIYAQIAWMATLMIRVHHWTPAQTGAVLAIFTLLGAPSAATVGWFVSSLGKRGKTDAPLLAMVAHSLALGLAGPCVWLMPEPIYAAPFYGVMLLVSNWTSSSALMGLAQITPNELRGQITAIHSFATGLVSLTLGSYSVGFLSDHVYAGPTSLAPGLATAFATFGLSAFAVLMLGRAAYRAATERAGSWRGQS